METGVLKDISQTTRRILSFIFRFVPLHFLGSNCGRCLCFVYFSIPFLCRVEAFLPIDGEGSLCCLAAMSVYLLGTTLSLFHSREYSKAVLKHIQLGNVVSSDFVKKNRSYFPKVQYLYYL
jgi:hypothetical protein